ncbi:MAG: hypothetical protein K9M07_05555 [Simkaniaceae bacterium]|nr:hypothetical protein [Simkaniaceae bacterium]
MSIDYLPSLSSLTPCKPTILVIVAKYDSISSFLTNPGIQFIIRRIKTIANVIFITGVDRAYGMDLSHRSIERIFATYGKKIDAVIICAHGTSLAIQLDIHPQKNPNQALSIENIQRRLFAYLGDQCRSISFFSCLVASPPISSFAASVAMFSGKIVVAAEDKLNELKICLNPLYPQAPFPITLESGVILAPCCYLAQSNSLIFPFISVHIIRCSDSIETYPHQLEVISTHLFSALFICPEQLFMYMHQLITMHINETRLTKKSSTISRQCVLLLNRIKAAYPFVYEDVFKKFNRKTLFLSCHVERLCKQLLLVDLEEIKGEELKFILNTLSHISSKSYITKLALSLISKGKPLTAGSLLSLLFPSDWDLVQLINSYISDGKIKEALAFTPYIRNESMTLLIAQNFY